MQNNSLQKHVLQNNFLQTTCFAKKMLCMFFRKNNLCNKLFFAKRFFGEKNMVFQFSGRTIPGSPGSASITGVGYEIMLIVF